MDLPNPHVGKSTGGPFWKILHPRLVHDGTVEKSPAVDLNYQG